MAIAAAAFDAIPSGFAILPLQPTIGAEVRGVDLSRPISDTLRDELKAAVLRHRVLFFRDQTLDTARCG
jgi:taurine dioxygenase